MKVKSLPDEDGDEVTFLYNMRHVSSASCSSDTKEERKAEPFLQNKTTILSEDHTATCAQQELPRAQSTRRKYTFVCSSCISCCLVEGRISVWFDGALAPALYVIVAPLSLRCSEGDDNNTNKRGSFTSERPTRKTEG